MTKRANFKEDLKVSSKPLTEHSEVDFTESSPNVDKDEVSWSVHESSPAHVKDDVIFAEAVDRYVRRTYRIETSDKLLKIIETSADGKRWTKFFEATLVRAK